MKNGDYSTNCRVLPLVCEPKISIEETTIDHPQKITGKRGRTKFCILPQAAVVQRQRMDFELILLSIHRAKRCWTAL